MCFASALYSLRSSLVAGVRYGEGLALAAASRSFSCQSPYNPSDIRSVCSVLFKLAEPSESVVKFGNQLKANIYADPLAEPYLIKLGSQLAQSDGCSEKLKRFISCLPPVHRAAFFKDPSTQRMMVDFHPQPQASIPIDEGKGTLRDNSLILIAGFARFFPLSLDAYIQELTLDNTLTLLRHMHYFHAHYDFSILEACRNDHVWRNHLNHRLNGHLTTLMDLCSDYFSAHFSDVFDTASCTHTREFLQKHHHFLLLCVTTHDDAAASQDSDKTLRLWLSDLLFSMEPDAFKNFIDTIDSPRSLKVVWALLFCLNAPITQSDIESLTLDSILIDTCSYDPTLQFKLEHIQRRITERLTAALDHAMCSSAT